MQIYANYLKRAQLKKKNPPKDVYLYLGNLQKKRVKIFHAFQQETRKTKSWVQLDPLMHLRVKQLMNLNYVCQIQNSITALAN